MDLFYSHIEQLQMDLLSMKPNDIDEKYHLVCAKLSGEFIANAIKDLDLSLYTSDLRMKLERDLADLDQGVKAIYFEYDMDNSWEGAFYFCLDYEPLEKESDDWASNWDHYLEGPSCKPFSDIYINIGGLEDEDEVGITLYLITRTIMAFISATEKLSVNIPLCIVFHDQDQVMRMAANK